MSARKKLYAERDIISMDKSGNFYCQHISAMTGEKLHSKSDIAAELGHRDMIINDLLIALQQLVERYDDPTGKQWTTTSKREALANARAAIDKALGE